jgi:hypothetical protein
MYGYGSYDAFYMHQCKHSSTYQTVFTDTCSKYHTMTVYTTVFLKKKSSDWKHAENIKN